MAELLDKEVKQMLSFLHKFFISVVLKIDLSIMTLTIALLGGIGGTYKPGNLATSTLLRRWNSLYLLNISKGPSLSMPFEIT